MKKKIYISDTLLCYYRISFFIRKLLYEKCTIEVWGRFHRNTTVSARWWAASIRETRFPNGLIFFPICADWLTLSVCDEPEKADNVSVRLLSVSCSFVPFVCVAALLWQNGNMFFVFLIFQIITFYKYFRLFHKLMWTWDAFQHLACTVHRKSSCSFGLSLVCEFSALFVATTTIKTLKKRRS